MLTAFSFMDEEILALAERGTEVFIPTYPLTENPAPESKAHRSIHLRPLPGGAALAELRDTLTLLARNRSLIPGSAWRDPFRLFHVARIQSFAARLAHAHDIDLIHSHFGWPDGFGGVLTRTATGLPLVATLRGMDVLVEPAIDYGLRLDQCYDDAIR